jgi:uncharacterized membrane protein YjjB (DUF3815 family)
MKELALAYLGSYFPSVIFNIDRRNIHLAGVSGALGWGVYTFFLNRTDGVIFPIFMGAVAIGVYGEIMARIRKTPATIFTIAGIFPLVPGIGAYNTVLAIVENRLMDAYTIGLETIGSAGAIAFGIMLASAIFRFFNKWKNG